MKAVRLKLYQNMVNYRRELSYKYVQSYPLPTPSMVKGMAHALLNLDEYHKLKISIQGNYESVVTNMQKVYKFDRKGRYPKKVFVGKSEQSINQGVMFVDEMVDMELLLHISFDEEELNEKLLEAVRQKTVILGRNEDIAYVDFEQTRFVDIFPSNDEHRLRYHIYLQPEICKNEQLEGTYYRLPFYYESVKSFNDKRIFKYVDAVYIARDKKIQYSDIMVDKDNNIVSFLSI